MEGRGMSLRAKIFMCDICKRVSLFLLESTFCANTWTNYLMQKEIWPLMPFVYSVWMEYMLPCKVDEDGNAYVPLFHHTEACTCVNEDGDLCGIRAMFRAKKEPASQGTRNFPCTQLVSVTQRPGQELPNMNSTNKPLCGFPLVTSEQGSRKSVPVDEETPVTKELMPYWKVVKKQKPSISVQQSAESKLSERLKKKALDETLSCSKGHCLPKYLFTMMKELPGIPTQILKAMGRWMIIWVDGLGWVWAKFVTRWSIMTTNTHRVQWVEPDTSQGSFLYYLAFEVSKRREYRVPHRDEKQPTHKQPCCLVYSRPGNHEDRPPQEHGTHSLLATVEEMTKWLEITADFWKKFRAGRSTIHVHGTWGGEYPDSVLDNLSKLRGQGKGSFSDVARATRSNGHLLGDVNESFTRDLADAFLESVFDTEASDDTEMASLLDGSEQQAAAASVVGSVAPPAAAAPAGAADGERNFQPHGRVLSERTQDVHGQNVRLYNDERFLGDLDMEEED